MKDATFRFRAAAALCVMLLLIATGAGGNAAAQGGAKTYETPQKAIADLVDAAKKKDAAALVGVLGPATQEWIISGDPVQDEEARARFVAAYDVRHMLQIENDASATLYVGEDDFPFPFPLVKSGAGWAFDPERGKEEILARRIGENELTTIQVLLAVVDAQKDYASVDRDGDGLREYASRFGSSEGKHDGLYWPSKDGEALSPLGPLVVVAASEGYAPKATGPDSDETNAFHGYRFKLLTRQGADATGGAHDYMVNGKMIGGFAVLAWPAKYGASGIMTFAVNHDGQIYETDLGPDTQSAAKQIDTFNPGPDWSRVEQK